MGFVLDRSDKDNQLWTDDLFSKSSFKVLQVWNQNGFRVAWIELW